MWKAESRRTDVLGQLGQKKKNLVRPHLNGKKLDMWHSPVIPVTVRSIKQEDHGAGQPRQKARPSL
jgi:hypothetical protein